MWSVQQWDSEEFLTNFSASQDSCPADHKGGLERPACFHCPVQELQDEDKSQAESTHL